jgi:hypothetical protein
MAKGWASLTRGVACAALLACAVVPAGAAAPKKRAARGLAVTQPLGAFTPAAADPRAATSFARAGVDASAFRFTPSAAPGSRRAVTVAVRAQRTNLAAAKTLADAPASVTPVTPSAYNLGVSVGWKRFAVTGELGRIDTGMMPGARESADVQLSYSAKNWSTRVVLGADRTETAGLVGLDTGYSVDLGGSYALTRNLDVTAGARYRLQRDGLQPVTDLRRDSQAVYLGTAFRF